METITLAGGCFWCTEAIFQRLKGVKKVVSGYANSTKGNPDFEDVSSGNINAAEAIQVTYDPKVISFETLLEVFWNLHDPTTLNRQGADTGTQYRSAIFFNTEKQMLSLITWTTTTETNPNPTAELSSTQKSPSSTKNSLIL